MPVVIFIALLDLGKKSSFVDRHYLQNIVGKIVSDLAEFASYSKI
jgi:hypothetical protein